MSEQTLSRWCAERTITTTHLTTESGEPEDVQMSGHVWCGQQRWHDEYHGKDPGCCASPDEKESWACSCACHLIDAGLISTSVREALSGLELEWDEAEAAVESIMELITPRLLDLAEKAGIPTRGAEESPS